MAQADFMRGISSYIFVYGTLLPTTRWHEHFAKYFGARIGRAFVPGKIYHLLDGWPILVPNDSGSVWGEVFSLQDVSALIYLDAYEGCEMDADKDSMICRDIIKATLEDGATYDVWHYFAPPALADFATETGLYLADGDWLAWAEDNLVDWKA